MRTKPETLTTGAPPTGEHDVRANDLILTTAEYLGIVGPSERPQLSDDELAALVARGLVS